MPDSQVGQAFSIERRQRLLVETDGHARETSEVFVKVYRDMATSGLLADLSGNELKVLLALGLEAKVLGGAAEAERHFERLKALGVVTDRDRGRLFCYLDRDSIAERTGLSTRTISTVGKALASKELIEKRSVRSRSGRHDYNVYFIRPASHLGKFDFNRRSSADDGDAEAHRGKNLPTVGAVGNEPPAAGFPYVEKGSNSRSSGKDLDTEVFAHFAERQGAERYEPTERDVNGLAQVRAEGSTQDQILSAIAAAFESRNPDALPIRQFTYCLPILRAKEPSAQQLQPVPCGSPVATQLVEELRKGEDPRTSTPVEVSPMSEKAEVEGVVLTMATIEDEWEAEMERVCQMVRKTGWPVGDILKTALSAKAVRVDEVARMQGADGPAWVGEAMLIAVGRKVGKNGHRAPADEEILAYADGVLANWTQKGRPRAIRETRSSNTTHQREASKGNEWFPEACESHLVDREPKSQEEELWEQVLGELQLQMTRATFDHWLRGSMLVKLHRPENGVARLVVRVVSHHAVDWLEHRLKRVIQRTVERRLGQEAELAFLAPNQPERAVGDE